MTITFNSESLLQFLTDTIGISEVPTHKSCSLIISYIYVELLYLLSDEDKITPCQIIMKYFLFK